MDSLVKARFDPVFRSISPPAANVVSKSALVLVTQQAIYGANLGPQEFCCSQINRTLQSVLYQCGLELLVQIQHMPTFES